MATTDSVKLLNISKKTLSRDSNMELARIVAMIMILLMHFIGQGLLGDCYPSPELYPTLQSLGIEKGGLLFFYILLMPATTVFVLISGFYKIKLTWKSFISFWLLCSFYNLVSVFAHHDFSVSSIISAFIISKTNQWFIQSYFWLMLVSPLLNTAIEKYDVRKMRWVALTGFVLCGLSGWYFGNNTNGYNIVYLCYAYLLGAYLRKEECLGRISGGRYLILFFSLIVIEFLAVLTSFYLLHIEFRYSWHNCPFIILSACCLFMAFRSLSFHNRVINVWASTMISLLLLTEVCFVDKLFPYVHQAYISGSGQFVFIFIGLVILSVVSSAVIELVRKSVAEPIVNYISEHLTRIQHSILNDRNRI